MTTMAAAFAKSGVLPRDAALWRAIAQFQNNGGTYEIALAMLERAYRKGAGGEGHLGEVAKARHLFPSRPSIEKAVNHYVGKAAAAMPNQPRGISAIASVQPTMAKSLFDTILLPDGRRLRHVRYSECPALARKYRTVAHILTAIHNFAIPPDANASIESIVTEKELATIVSNAEKSNA